MTEITLNLHIHTNFSDGSLPHKNIARAALHSGLDAILITDHNIRPQGLEGYFQESGKKVLVMIGEEIHNPDRQPQKSHLLVWGTDQDLAEYGEDPQKLIDMVNQCGGMCFLAHPYDPALPAFHEDSISWEDWQVSGYQGIELWNGFSELKVRANNRWQAIFLGLFPKFIAHQPPSQTLKIWDNLLSSGKKVVAVCGSDAHASHYHIGPIQKTIFPYEFHFQAINNHILLETPLNGDAAQDSLTVQKALAHGHCFIAYDLPANSRGFRFLGKVDNQILLMGDEARFKAGLKLEIQLPYAADCRLLKDGQVVQRWKTKTKMEYQPVSQGVYQVECYRQFLGKKRGWIFSNPIYLR